MTQMNLFTKRRLTDVENTLMFTKGEEGVVRSTLGVWEKKVLQAILSHRTSSDHALQH